jgi:hypothetical protein
MGEKLVISLEFLTWERQDLLCFVILDFLVLNLSIGSSLFMLIHGYVVMLMGSSSKRIISSFTSFLLCKNQTSHDFELAAD